MRENTKKGLVMFTDKWIFKCKELIFSSCVLSYLPLWERKFLLEK